MPKVNYRILAVSVCVFLIAATYLLTGPLGLVILIPSTTLGMLPPLLGVKRVHLMGCLIIPTFLFLMNYDAIVLGLLGLT